MCKFKHFVGIDVSKEKFDAAIIQPNFNCQIQSFELVNSAKGVKQLLKDLKKKKIDLVNVLFCLEHTGLYGSIIINELLKNKANVWIEMAYTIKHSIGIQRGKTDKIDAIRIAEYAARFQDKVLLYKPSNQNLATIKALLALREKLQKAATGLKVHLNDLKKFDATSYKIAKTTINSSINKLNKDLKEIDSKIDTIISQDTQLENIFNIATSVVGVGRITTLHLICFTNLFTTCKNAKQLACYCGVVPFQFTSGKSVRKKPKVHYMANKKMKKLLQLCAMVAVKYDPELKQYYERKVDEGKNKMLVLNNVRNKLIHRVFITVKRGTPYIKKVA